MGMFEEPLLHAIVQAHHDPDPIRAHRFKPHHYGAVSARPESAAHVRPGWLPNNPLRRLSAVWPLRPAPAEPCCCCPAPVC
jgi:hypothetical protein